MARQHRHGRLVWLVDGEVVVADGDGPNRRAAEQVVTHARSMGRLEAGDYALAQCVTMLGEACDCDPTNAALWAQYRAALHDLRTLCGTEGTSDIDQILAQLVADDSPAPVRDTTKRKQAQSRRADSKSRSDAGSASDATPATRRRGGDRDAARRDTGIS